VLWAGLVTALLFVPLEWNGCGYFRHGTGELFHILCFLTWLIVFFWLRMKWRLLLLGLTIPILVIEFGLNGIPEENAGPEAAAVRDLRQLRSSIEDYRRGNQQGSYPNSVSSIRVVPLRTKFYKLEYVPNLGVNGRVVNYVIRATPVRWECDFPLSFTIAGDGTVYFTREPRAATPSDKPL
jgi:hypothetical protein